jgi:hypothetical protein
MKIITHPGQAHRDEFIACALLLAHCPEADSVERREPTPEELDDPEVMVVDVGGQHDPLKSNFDHHQFPRDFAPCCAVTLVLQSMHKRLLAREVFPWLGFTELFDSKGPNQAAKELGMTPEALQQTMSPIEAQVLRMFQSRDRWAAGDLPFALMMMMGEEWLAYLDAVSTRLRRLDLLCKGPEGSESPYDVIRGDVLDLHAITDQPTLGLELWIKLRKRDKDIKVTVTQDDRGPGLALFRRNDDPSIDFSRIEGHPKVHFAHRNGFLCKTKTRLKVEEIDELIDLARVPEPVMA